MDSLKNKLNFMKKTTNPTSALIKQDAQKIEEIETRYLGVIKKMEKELATINLLGEQLNATNLAIQDYMEKIKEISPRPEQIDQRYYAPINGVFGPFSELHRQMGMVFSQLHDTLNQTYVEEQKKYLHDMVKNTKASKDHYEHVLGDFAASAERLRVLSRAPNTPPSAQRLTRAREDEAECRAALEEAELDTTTTIKETFEAQAVEMMQKQVEAFDIFRSVLTRLADIGDKQSVPLSTMRDELNHLNEEVEIKQKKRGQRVIGVSLEKLLKREGKTSGIPDIIRGAFREIALNRASQEGLFRINPKVLMFNDLKRRVQTNEAIVWESEDTNCITNFLKLFLRSLPEPLFLFENYDELVAIPSRALSEDAKAQLIRDVVCRLPPPQRCCLEHLVGMAEHILEHQSTNLMTENNLAVCFAPNLLYSDKPQRDDIAMEQALQCQEVIKILLEKRNIIFPHARETLDAISETQTEQQDDSAPEDPFFVRAAALLGPAPEKPAPLQRGASKQEYKEYMKANYAYTTWFEKVTLQANKLRQEESSAPAAATLPLTPPSGSATPPSPAQSANGLQGRPRPQPPSAPKPRIVQLGLNRSHPPTLPHPGTPPSTLPPSTPPPAAPLPSAPPPTSPLPATPAQ